MKKHDRHDQIGKDRLEEFWYQRGFFDASQGRPNVAERTDFAKNQGARAHDAYIIGFKAGLDHRDLTAA